MYNDNVNKGEFQEPKEMSVQEGRVGRNQQTVSLHVISYIADHSVLIPALDMYIFHGYRLLPFLYLDSQISPSCYFIDQSTR